MKAYRFASLVPVVMFMLAACSVEPVEELVVDPVVPAGVHRISVHAGTPESRTVITPDGNGGYHFSWSDEDQIVLFEATDGDVRSYYSDNLESAGDVATFHVNLDDRTSESGAYQYVGVYGNGNDVVYWVKSSSPHISVIGEIPSIQYISEGMYDPQADLLVSRAVDMEDRPETDLSLSFARIGAVVKMTLKGLPVGSMLERVEFTSGDSFQPAGSVEVDPVAGTATPLEDQEMGGGIFLSPEDLVVNDSNEATVWFRTLSGRITDGFSVTADVQTEEEEYLSFFKSVDLASSSRSLRLRDGGLTEFSVTLLRDYGVESRITGGEPFDDCLKLDVEWSLNDAPYETAEYGVDCVPQGGGAKRTVAVTPDVDGFASVTVPGLGSGTVYTVKPYVILDGVRYDGTSSAWKTTGGTYLQPERVDLGLPSGVMWASMNVGATSVSDKGDLFSWGEVKPRLEDTGSNKFMQYATALRGETLSPQNLPTKYAFNLSRAFTLDMKSILDPEDDAASAILGGDWRMPTGKEIDELREYCNSETVQKGDDETYPSFVGTKFTSKINGNVLYVPSAYEDNERSAAFWGSTILTNSAYVIGQNKPHGIQDQLADCLSDGASHYGENRTTIKPVRAVSGGTPVAPTLNCHITRIVSSGGQTTVTAEMLVDESDYVAIGKEMHYDYKLTIFSADAKDNAVEQYLSSSYYLPMSRVSADNNLWTATFDNSSLSGRTWYVMAAYDFWYWANAYQTTSSHSVSVSSEVRILEPFSL